MPESTVQATTQQASRRKTIIGQVVSTKMNKTIVVEATRTFPHRLYRRVISRSKKFYAHDEQNTAHVGDFVRIEETRPLSKLKRWRLQEVIRRAALVNEPTQTEAEAS